MKTGIIVQSRMSSQRLPGKVLKELHGKAMIDYLLERLLRNAEQLPVIVATSTEADDDALAVHLQKHPVEVFRGSLENVTQRFVAACHEYQLEAFIRINGDSPLFDQNLISLCLQHLKPGVDIVSNIFPRSFPKGQSIEASRVESFEKHLEEMSEPRHFEHVFPWFYENAERFNIFNLQNNENFNGIQLSVDTREDFQVMEKIIASFEKEHWNYTWQELVEIHNQMHGE